MADNVPITAGAGTSVATDDVAGVHYQLVKLAFGALDTATLVSLTEGLPVQPERAASATLANVAGSAASVVLRAANTARLGLTIQNESTAILYVKFGATASVTSYTVQVPPGAYYEMPVPCYTGTVDGIWSAANGNARVTEMVS